MEASLSQKDTQILDDTEYQRESSNSPNDCASKGDSALANETDNQDDVAGVDIEVVPQHQAKEKRSCKKRKSNELSNNIHVITRIDGTGIFVSLAKCSGVYIISIGIIVRENVPIT
jgi:hypothetical protein